MILIFHIFVAVLSIIVSLLSSIAPSKQKLGVSFLFAGGTLLSGIVLAVSHPSTLPKVCISGAVFFIAILFLTIKAKQKLSASSLY